MSLAAAAPALAAPQAGHGDGRGKGGATQVTGGRNTANGPAIASAVWQLTSGKRTVNAPAGNNGVTTAGIQQKTSVSAFTNTLNGRCVAGIDDCGINQSMRAGGGGRRGGRG
nr:hypothetical protein [Microbispora rosea]